MGDVVLGAAVIQEEIVAGVQNGNREAEERLNAYFRPRLIVFAEARVRDRELARDIAQDVLIAVVEALRAGQLRDMNGLAGFVFGVAKNVVGTAIRRRTRERTDSLTDAAPVVAEEVDFISRERRALLRSAIEELPSKERDVLLLAAVEGLSSVEIAAKLGIREDSARQRKSRAMKKLAAKFSTVSQPAGATPLTDSNRTTRGNK